MHPRPGRLRAPALRRLRWPNAARHCRSLDAHPRRADRAAASARGRRSGGRAPLPRLAPPPAFRPRGAREGAAGGRPGLRLGAGAGRPPPGQRRLPAHRLARRRFRRLCRLHGHAGVRARRGGAAGAGPRAFHRDPLRRGPPRAVPPPPDRGLADGPRRRGRPPAAPDPRHAPPTPRLRPGRGSADHLRRRTAPPVVSELAASGERHASPAHGPRPWLRELLGRRLSAPRGRRGSGTRCSCPPRCTCTRRRAPRRGCARGR